MNIYHFEAVDKDNITAKFTDDGKHRLYLEIPFLNRRVEKTLCIIGQNPSNANKEFADRTILYLEIFVYKNLPQYSKIIVLNLYSRIDTDKNLKDDLIREDCEILFQNIIRENKEFLIVYGKLKNQGAYNFVEKAKTLQSKLIGKSIYKIDTGSSYAPHPRNPAKKCGKYNLGMTGYNFEDIE